MSFSHFPMSFPIFCQTFSLFNFIIIIIIIIIYIYIYITEAFGAPTIFHVTTNFFFISYIFIISLQHLIYFFPLNVYKIPFTIPPPISY